MNWNKADYECSFGLAEQLMPSDRPEFCFSGRSNVGKSTLLNTLVNRKGLARVSTKPGKTVTINFFTVDHVRFVDLPGYGYAKVPFAVKDRWSDLMESYFGSGRDIRLCFQLIDVRHAPTEFDRSMLRFLHINHIPCAVILTKCDKLNKSELTANCENIKKEVEQLLPGCPVFPYSGLKATGRDEIRAYIESLEE